MKHFTSFIILTPALLLVACASSLPKPERYGFERVALNGQDSFCAPPEWVIPPVVAALWVPAADCSGDIPSGLLAATYPKTHQVCLTQAQWLTMRTRWNRDWAVTPGIAEGLAAQRAAGS
jgi:hypothetical protein